MTLTPRQEELIDDQMFIDRWLEAKERGIQLFELMRSIRALPDEERTKENILSEHMKLVSQAVIKHRVKTYAVAESIYYNRQCPKVGETVFNKINKNMMRYVAPMLEKGVTYEFIDVTFRQMLFDYIKERKEKTKERNGMIMREEAKIRQQYKIFINS
jgi:hypothetical protein